MNTPRPPESHVPLEAFLNTVCLRLIACDLERLRDRVSLVSDVGRRPASAVKMTLLGVGSQKYFGCDVYGLVLLWPEGVVAYETHSR